MLKNGHINHQHILLNIIEKMPKGYINKHILYNVFYNKNHEGFFIGEKGVLGENGTHIDWEEIIKFLEENGYKVIKIN